MSMRMEIHHKNQGRRVMESVDPIRGLSTLESLRGFELSNLTLGITRDVTCVKCR
jgi:hypothetical protein